MVLLVTQKNGKSYKIINLVGKPKISEAPSNLTVVGRYPLNENIYKSKMKSGHNNEVQLTDSLSC